ncbi:MAG TPA: alpha/beta fold hydrolase [Kofleriaceae bacterium]|nr:alpha/beta fold hydrolase [Kofleriaceae bacterium]
MRGARALVGTYHARDGRVAAIELAYDVFGARGRPLVLVMGIGAQRIFWDVAFCEQLVAAGFQVVRFDHRDTGESTRLDAAVPSPGGVLARRLLGGRVPAPYTLSDMASDVVGLADALGWSRVHVVGASLGGMVGQHLAIEHPDRIHSLTAIMTTPGARRFLPKPFALRALFTPPPNDARAAGEHAANLFATIGSTAWHVDRERLSELGSEAFTRGMNPKGFLRQFAAVGASGDRARRLRGVRVPTLVVHGSRDPMFPLAAGRALARLVPGSTWLPITGMGHDLPSPVWPTLVAAIARHAERAETRGEPRATDQ